MIGHGILLTLCLAGAAPSSGGPLSPWQAAFDVKRTELNLRIDPSTQTVAGHAVIEALLLEPGLDRLEFDLYEGLVVSKAAIAGTSLAYLQRGHKLWVMLPADAGLRPRVRIEYAGKPQVAERPPWDGGFNWSRTDNGKPWVGVSCQGEGGMVWYPCKTHPSDKIEGLSLTIEVPEPLYCAANGLLREVRQAGPGWRAFRWETDQPISSYNVTVNIAEYQVEERRFPGDPSFPVVFYFLKEPQEADLLEGDPASYASRRDALMAMTNDYLAFYIRKFGPYPFEKFGLAHTAYLGMEHQGVNSYGAHFNTEHGYDFILLHEMGHEWWGNKVSVADWADFWIHEGICTYANIRYVAEALGQNAELEFLRRIRGQIRGEKPLVPRRPASADAPPTPDVYYKGAWMLRGLQWLVGVDAVDLILKSYAMSPAFTYANQTATQDFIDLAETLSGRELDWFFQVFLYRTALPKLTIRRHGETAWLWWDWSAFEMPVELEIKNDAGEARRLRAPMAGGKSRVALAPGETLRVDPGEWLLMELDAGDAAQ